MKHHENDHKPEISDIIARFISKNKLLLWGLLGLVAVLVVVFAVVDNNAKKLQNFYSDKSAELNEDFSKWMTTPSDEKEAVETELLLKIEGIVSDEKMNVLVERALFIRGQIHLNKEEWDKAYNDFMMIAEKLPESYLASISLYNGATAKENNGESEEALSLLNRISEKYGATSPIIPEVFFNIGRINETIGDQSSALKAYESIASDYASSNWTNLAKTRIISLKASGVTE